MPTPKQVRQHYKAIHYFAAKLRRALYKARDAKVVEFTDWKTESPMTPLCDLEDRVEKTTEKSRAQAFKEECLK